MVKEIEQKGKNRLLNAAMSEKMRKKTFPYINIAPALVFLIVFTVYPMFKLIYLSFFKYDLVSKPVFVGWKNYDRLFSIEVSFWNAVSNTAVYTVSVVAILIFLAVLLAVWLQKDSLINRIIERVMFLPHLCAGIAVALIFQWLFDEEGAVNAILSLLSLPTFRWLNSSSTAMICVVIVSIWKSMGYYALIIMSSLKSIPSEINEAADLDDAGSIRRFFRITLPMLSPQLFFLFITITIGSFKVFESVRILTGGGPGDSTDVLVFWIYRKAFSGTVNVGLASAAGVILMIILAIFTVFYYLSMGKKVHYQ